MRSPMVNLHHSNCTVKLFASEAPFTRVRTNLCTDKNLHSSALRLHGTGGTGRIFERLSVQVWDLKKAGQLFDRHGSVRSLYGLV